MINENGILAHPHPLFSFFAGMATNDATLRYFSLRSPYSALL
ncbi:hypothetical protein [Floridanema aerugineum]|uniref:Uncharacterized protein n=1 Tax=Floridaenema aerugineum BLCC-F46 TaxID=3153654 RepID=A0ABV4X9I4_9CYAN